MSHTLAAQCTVCGLVDDMPCPECGTPSSTTHGTSVQRPWTCDPDPDDGYVHEWHPECAAKDEATAAEPETCALNIEATVVEGETA